MKNIGLVSLLATLLFFGCEVKEKKSDSSKLQILTTTGMLYDAVTNIAKDKVDVEALMGPGVDPHLYKASQGDLSKLNNADIVFYNGLLLEGKMSEILDKLARIKPIVAAANSIPDSLLLTAAHYENAFDPHIWFDVNIWKYAIEEISKSLQKHDSANADFYAQNTKGYLLGLDTLHSYVRQKIQSIPEKQRILVTAHDAFGYFGKAYEIEVVGLQGISTVSDFGLRDISNLTDLIMENNIKAIFIETSVSDKAINAVVTGCQNKGHDVKIGGSLYSDAMGPFDTAEGTYIGMVKKNVDVITESLR
ncbi:MAG: zinc ABC transporter substrate-binding protein [Cyclobacteriaceae bacterium]